MAAESPKSPAVAHRPVERLRCDKWGAASRTAMSIVCSTRARDRGQGRASTPEASPTLDAGEDAPEGAEVRHGSHGDPARTSARCCPLLPTQPSSTPHTPGHHPLSSSARRSAEEVRPLLDLLDPPCWLWAVWTSTVEHPVMCEMKFFFLAERRLSAKHHGGGTTRARSCAERSGRTQRGTITLMISS